MCCREARVAHAPEQGRGCVERRRKDDVVQVRVPDRVEDLGDRRKAHARAVCGENLAVGEVNEFGHCTPGAYARLPHPSRCPLA